MPLPDRSASAPRAENSWGGLRQVYARAERILRLALLAPDIVEARLAGRTDQAIMLERLERPLPASWEEQRLLVCSAAPS
jgi:hypothetical protein